MILVSHSQNSKAYQCYYLKTGRIIISTNVFFIESKDNVIQSYHPGVEIPKDANESKDGVGCIYSSIPSNQV